MGRFFSRLPAAAVASLVGALIAVPAAAEPVPEPEHVPIWDKGPGGERYVAFGDSFVSGPDIPVQRAACGRSDHNFPTLVAEDLGVRSYVDASCSGATTHHFTEPQVASASYTNPPQLDALSADTTLVTFGTMGGNDVNLVGLAAACAFGECVPPPGTDPLAEAFEGAETRLVAALAETLVRAPAADVFVVGHGTYLPPGGCPAAVPLTSAEADYLQSQIDRLSDLLERIAADHDVPFVDQRDIPGILDHTVCAAPEDQWIRGLEAYGDGTLFHPSTAGMRATADHVLTRVVEERAIPTVAERRAALKAKAMTVTARATCIDRGRHVRVRVRGGQGAVTRAVLRAGGTRLRVDATAPYVVRVKARRLQRLPGQLMCVRVTLRDQELRQVARRTVQRPRCAR